MEIQKQIESNALMFWGLRLVSLVFNSLDKDQANRYRTTNVTLAWLFHFLIASETSIMGGSVHTVSLVKSPRVARASTL